MTEVFCFFYTTPKAGMKTMAKRLASVQYMCRGWMQQPRQVEQCFKMPAVTNLGLFPSTNHSEWKECRRVFSSQVRGSDTAAASQQQRTMNSMKEISGMIILFVPVLSFFAVVGGLSISYYVRCPYTLVNIITFVKLTHI
jgi:hypothetical protein